MWDSIANFISSVYETSHIRAKIIATIIALIALPIVRRFIISPLISKIKNNEKRYKWNKAIVYSFYFLFFFIVGSIWFEGFESNREQMDPGRRGIIIILISHPVR